MPIHDDGDIIKGVGFVSIYFAHLEDDLDEVLARAGHVFNYWHPRIERWRFRDKARFLQRGFREAFAKYPNARYADEDKWRCGGTLRECRQIAQRRNDILHRPIFGAPDGGSAQSKNLATCCQSPVKKCTSLPMIFMN